MEGTYDAICTWEEDAETEQTEQRPTNHPEDTESRLKVKYTTTLLEMNAIKGASIDENVLKPYSPSGHLR